MASPKGRKMKKIVDFKVCIWNRKKYEQDIEIKVKNIERFGKRRAQLNRLKHKQKDPTLDLEKRSNGTIGTENLLETPPRSSRYRDTSDIPRKKQKKNNNTRSKFSCFFFLVNGICFLTTWLFLQQNESAEPQRQNSGLRAQGARQHKDNPRPPV